MDDTHDDWPPIDPTETTAGIGVGRIVHYYPSKKIGPWAAIVTAIDRPGIDLTAFPPGAGVFVASNVPHGTGSTPPQQGIWVWPPRT